MREGPASDPPPEARFAAVVPAAGLGLRMGSRKLLLPIDGTPILVHALRRLRMARGCVELVLAVHRDDMDEMLARADQLAVTRVVEGGATRQQSVLAALRAVSEDIALVLIHDAVRPLVRVAVVEAVAVRAADCGAAIAATPSVATVKEVDGRGFIRSTPPREGLWMAQTPQGFARELAVQAHEAAARDGFLGTDDAQLVERLGRPVAVVRDSPDNVKITTREDLVVAEAILAWQRREALPEAQH